MPQPSISMQRAGERAPAQCVAGIRLLGKQLRQGHRDLLVDFDVLLRAERWGEADVSNEKVAAVARARTAVRHFAQIPYGESPQCRVALEEGVDLARDGGC